MSACRSPRARNRLTSSTNPSSTIASKRRSIRTAKSGRLSGTSASARIVGLRAGSPARCSSVIGLPVSAWTSSARWMRCRSLGAIRTAAAGSTCAQSFVQRRPAVRGGFAVDPGANVSIGTRQRRRALRAARANRAVCRRRATATAHERGSLRRGSPRRARTVPPSTTPSAPEYRRDDAARRRVSQAKASPCRCRDRDTPSRNPC